MATVEAKLKEAKTELTTVEAKLKEAEAKLKEAKTELTTVEAKLTEAKETDREESAKIYFDTVLAGVVTAQRGVDTAQTGVDTASRVVAAATDQLLAARNCEGRLCEHSLTFFAPHHTPPTFCPNRAVLSLHVHVFIVVGQVSPAVFFSLQSTNLRGPHLYLVHTYISHITPLFDGIHHRSGGCHISLRVYIGPFCLLWVPSSSLLALGPWWVRTHKCSCSKFAPLLALLSPIRQSGRDANVAPASFTLSPSARLLVLLGLHWVSTARPSNTTNAVRPSVSLAHGLKCPSVRCAHHPDIR
jgi:hypothetical protein